MSHDRPIVAARVDAVTVYENGALVTRRLTVPSSAGGFVVDDLPLRFVDDSLQVRPRSSSSSSSSSSPATAPAVRLVEERCRVAVRGGGAAVDAAAILEADLEVQRLEGQLRTLDTLRTLADVQPTLPPPEVTAAAPDVQGWLAHLAVAADRRAALDTEERRLQTALRERRAERDELRRREGTDVDAEVRRGVEVHLSAPAEAGAEYELAYFVEAARWTPSYALAMHSRPDGTGSDATLVVGALIAQASGEAWDDVEVSVSTTSYSRASTLPELVGWRLGRAQPHKPTGFRPLPTDLPGLFAAWDRFPALQETMRSAPTPSGGRPPPPPPPATPPPPPPPPSPMPMAAPVQTMAFGGLERDEEASARFDDEADDSDDVFAADLGAPMMEISAGVPGKPMAPAAAMAPPGAAMLRQSSMGPPPQRARDAAMAKKRGGAVGARGGGGGAASDDDFGAPAPPPPPRLRTSSMRLAFADEGALRGTLVPLNLRERLQWLVEVADVDVDGRHGLSSSVLVAEALGQLERAEARLRQRHMPAGVAPLSSSPARRFGSGSRASIPSDGRDHRVEVHREAAPVEITHVCVPRESFNVWRTVRLTPRGALPAGPVQVTEDHVFVVAGTVRGSGGAGVTFNLGVDPRVVVEARTPTIHQSEKGLMGGSSCVEHSVVTEIRSTSSSRVELLVYDRFPVADVEARDIVVDIGECTPPVEVDGRDHEGRAVKGAFHWHQVLMPNETRSLRHRYTLTLPAKLEVMGGNRRE